jgi:hypothetical protein
VPENDLLERIIDLASQAVDAEEIADRKMAEAWGLLRQAVLAERERGEQIVSMARYATSTDPLGTRARRRA